MNKKILNVRQVRSAIGRDESHKACLKGLGIRTLHKTVKVLATPENLGMINKISYMLKVED
jgi:large subunit ribosomal protein L30